MQIACYQQSSYLIATVKIVWFATLGEKQRIVLVTLIQVFDWLKKATGFIKLPQYLVQLNYEWIALVHPEPTDFVEEGD